MRLDSLDFYKLMLRPTIVVSTISPNGVSNAAPFSFNSPVATRPVPLYGFCCEREHDTWVNVQENGEFVVNLVAEDFGPLMENLARDHPYEVSEILECGLTEASSKTVKPPRIKEAYGWLECRMTDAVDLSWRSVWVIGEVIHVEARDNVLDEVLDVENVKPLNHLAGEFFVTDMRRARFKR